MSLPILIIYFVGTRHSQWHTWVHHYFYLSWFLTLASTAAEAAKIHNFPLFANLRCYQWARTTWNTFSRVKKKKNSNQSLRISLFLIEWDKIKWIFMKSKHATRENVKSSVNDVRLPKISITAAVRLLLLPATGINRIVVENFFVYDVPLKQYLLCYACHWHLMFHRKYGYLLFEPRFVFMVFIVMVFIVYTVQTNNDDTPNSEKKKISVERGKHKTMQ